MLKALSFCTALLSMVLLQACSPATQDTERMASHHLTLSEANKLVELPLHCVETPYPYKTGAVLGSADDLKEPSVLHPVFYGCFDWHSAVHGYWSMVTLLQQYPDLEQADEVKAVLKRNLTAEKVAREVDFFSKDINDSFERTYGWAWLLKLSDELHSWKDPMAKELAANLQPLAD